MCPPQQTAMTPGDLSWVVQGQSPISGVLFLLGLTQSFFLSYCSKMLKLLCVFVGHGEPLAQGQARGCEACSCQLHLPLSHASSGCPPGLISSLDSSLPLNLVSPWVREDGAPGSTGPWPLPHGGLADGAGAALPHQGPSASLTGSHRCAWNGSARQRVWNKCAASWTRRPSGTSGTSRTPEGSEPTPLGRLSFSTAEP